MTTDEIQRQITGLGGQELIAWISRFSNGYNVNMISTGPHGFRIQMQPKKAYEDEEIVCVTAKHLVTAIEKALALETP